MAGVPEAIVAMLAAFALGTILNVGAAMLPPLREGRGVGARAAAVVITLAMLVIPFRLDAPPFFRAFLAEALVIETWRVLEIVRTPWRYGRRERALRVVLLP